MDEIEKLMKLVEGLSEALRQVSTDLLKVAKKANEAYSKYAEYINAEVTTVTEAPKNIDLGESIIETCANCLAVKSPGHKCDE